uniref:Integrase catalytic domain-containing protein n=1 Tax=Cannabis sativa TaxID=3483 RepID=A0A803NZ12_CANSA
METPEKGESPVAPTMSSAGNNPMVTGNTSSSSTQLPNTYLQHFSTLNQPFSLKLDKNNFTLWKTMVSTIVRGHRLDGFLNGTKPCPLEFFPTGKNEEGVEMIAVNPEFEHWIINDQLLMGWLYNSMTETIATEVMGSTTAAELWRALENLYGAYFKAKMDDTRTLIQTHRKGSSTMGDYLRQKKCWADSLALAGDPYPESHLISNVLSSLGAEYLTIIVQIEARSKTTWQELQDLLLSFDSKIERMQSLEGPKTMSPPVAHQANMATKPNTQGRGRAFYSQNQNSSNNGGRGAGSRGRSRGRGRFNNNSRPTCQVCGKFGHSAAVCYNRYDENFMGSDPHTQNQQKQGHNAFIATPEMLDSDAWFADSGTSNHVTSETSSMSQKSEYGGKETLTVGDGTVLDLVHTELWGPTPIASNINHHYYIHFVDDFSRYTWLYPLKHKSEALLAVQQFKTLVENKFEKKIKALRTDGGGEYQAFSNLVQEHGIEFHHSCPHTSAQNGRAKRKHRHIVKMEPTLLAQAAMPLKYWCDAFHTPVYLINRLPTPILSHKSPHEVLHN